MKDRLVRVVTADRLREVLSYEPDTGIFRWRLQTGPRAKIAGVAGCLNGDGYQVINIDGIAYKRSRLAWLYMTGKWPKNEIDHDDRDRANDRWLNLKEKTSAEQKHNRGRRSDNTSGYAGVSFHKASGKWRARVNDNAGEHCGHYWDTAEQARDERDRMRVALNLPPAIDNAPVTRYGIATNVLGAGHYCAICGIVASLPESEPIEFVLDAATDLIVCPPCKRAMTLARKDEGLLHSMAMLASRVSQFPDFLDVGYPEPRKETA